MQQRRCACERCRTTSSRSWSARRRASRRITAQIRIAATTRGRWDVRWGAGRLRPGLVCRDGIDEEGAWNLVDPTTPSRWPTSPPSGCAARQTRPSQGSATASCSGRATRRSWRRGAGAESRTATVVAKRAVFLDTPLREAVEAVVNDTKHAAARAGPRYPARGDPRPDRWRARVPRGERPRHRPHAHMTVPGALRAAALGVDGCRRRRLDAARRC